MIPSTRGASAASVAAAAASFRALSVVGSTSGAGWVIASSTAGRKRGRSCASSDRERPPFTERSFCSTKFDGRGCGRILAIKAREGSVLAGNALRVDILGGVTSGRPKKTITPFGVTAPLTVGMTKPSVPNANDVPAATGVVCSPSPLSVTNARTLGSATASLEELTGSMLAI